MTYRRWICALLVAAALLPAGAAQAQFRFGTDEEIHHLQDVTLKGAQNEALYLGYMTHILNIFGGVYVEDKGYVLGVKGESKKYYSMPTGDQLAGFQRNGFLPDPLPPYRLGFFDYVLGYSLWWIIAIIAIISLVSWVRKRGQPAPAAPVGAAMPTAAAPPAPPPPSAPPSA